MGASQPSGSKNQAVSAKARRLERGIVIESRLNRERERVAARMPSQSERRMAFALLRVMLLLESVLFWNAREHFLVIQSLLS